MGRDRDGPNDGVGANDDGGADRPDATRVPPPPLLRVRTATLGLIKDLTHGCTTYEAEVAVLPLVAGRREDGGSSLPVGSVVRSCPPPRPRPSCPPCGPGVGPGRGRDGEYVAAILWNLAAAASSAASGAVPAAVPSRSSTAVGRCLVGTPGVLDVLVGLVGRSGDDGRGGGGGGEARRAALSALGNLAGGGGSGGGRRRDGGRARPAPGAAEEDDEDDADGGGGGFGGGYCCARALLSHRDGAVLSALLSVAAEAASASDDGAAVPGTCDDAVARRRAVRAVRCLARNDGAGGLGLMAAASRAGGLGLVEKLGSIAVRDPDRTVRVQATEALASLPSRCPRDEEGAARRRPGCRTELTDALVGAVGGGGRRRRDARCAGVACGALSSRLSSPPAASSGTPVPCEGEVGEDRGEVLLLGEHPTLLPALLDLIVGDSVGAETKDAADVASARLAASDLLYKLSKRGENRDFMLLQSSAALMDSLASLLHEVAPDGLPPAGVHGFLVPASAVSLDAARTNAAGTVVELSRSSHRAKVQELVDHPTLLASFVNYCVTAEDGPVRDDAKEAVLKLVLFL